MFEQKDYWNGHFIPAAQLPQAKEPLKLKCGRCGSTGRYKVGAVLVNPFLIGRAKSPKDSSPLDVGDGMSFSAYFRCKRCNAGGPWKLTDEAMVHVLRWMEMLMRGDKDAPIDMGALCSCDGKIFLYPTDAEEHIRSLIATDPSDPFLYERLGNVFRNGGRLDLAKEPYLKAVAMDDERLESHFSLGWILQEEGDIAAATEHYHKCVDVIRHRKDIPLEWRINFMKGAINGMLDIHQESGGKIPFCSDKNLAELKESSAESIVLKIKECKLKRPTEWTEIMAGFLDEKPTKVRKCLRKIEWTLMAEMEDEIIAESVEEKGKESEEEGVRIINLPAIVPDDDLDYDDEPPLPLRAEPHISRNAPCACGSGKKYKKCCGKVPSADAQR